MRLLLLTASDGGQIAVNVDTIAAVFGFQGRTTVNMTSADGPEITVQQTVADVITAITVMLQDDSKFHDLHKERAFILDSPDANSVIKVLQHYTNKHGAAYTLELLSHAPDFI